MGTDSLDKILGIVCSVFDAYSSVLFLPDENSKDYYLAAKFSLGDKIRADTVISPGKGLAGWILRNRKPLLINNFDRKRSRPGYYDSDEEKKIKAFMGCPLRSGDGALCLDSKRTYCFSDKDQKILDLFSGLIAEMCAGALRDEQSLTEQRLYASLKVIYGLRKQFPRWPAFLRRFLELLSNATGFEHCFLAARGERGKSYFLEGQNQDIFSDKKQHKLKFPIKSGLIGWVFNNDAPVCTGEKGSRSTEKFVFGKNVESPPFKSVVCLPLIIHKRTRGVLVLAHKSPIDIPPEVKVFMEMAADHLALFLENLYLKNRLT